MFLTTVYMTRNLLSSLTAAQRTSQKQKSGNDKINKNTPKAPEDVLRRR